MNSLAYAMGAGGAGASGEGGGTSVFLMFGLIFVIFYFLLIRPQQKQAKQHREMIASLKKGDKIVSTGGLYGTITGLTDDVITMEIAPKVRVKITRASISRLMRKEGNKEGNKEGSQAA
jgi:preprotein translocase subunit YajC